MRNKPAHPRRAGEPWVADAMWDELSHALMEALYELEMVPDDQDAALVRLYAVMDDLQAALRRTEAMDMLRSA